MGPARKRGRGPMLFALAPEAGSMPAACGIAAPWHAAALFPAAAANFTAWVAGALDAAVTRAIGWAPSTTGAQEKTRLRKAGFEEAGWLAKTARGSNYSRIFLVSLTMVSMAPLSSLPFSKAWFTLTVLSTHIMTVTSASLANL